MDKKELLQMDVLSLQNAILKKIKEKEFLVRDIISLQNVIFKKIKEKEQIERDIGIIRKGKEQNLRVLQSQEQSLHAAISVARTELASLNVEKENRTKEIESQKHLHSAKHAEFGETFAAKTALEKELDRRIEEKNETLKNLSQRILSKTSEESALDERITVFKFEIENYQKTIKVAFEQLREIGKRIRQQSLIEQKLHTTIETIKKTLHITVEHILTARNRRLFARHQMLTAKNKTAQKKNG